MHAESVAPELLTVLREIMQTDDFGSFALGGGTSLALRYGHRRSEDLDLFHDAADRPFDAERMLEACRRIFERVEIVNRTPGSLCLIIEGTRVDLLEHAYPLLAPVELLDGVRVLAVDDLAALKINAVTNRGSKKDFSDLVLLHREGCELGRSLERYCAKYGDAGRFLALRSLLWFEEAEAEPDPRYLAGWTWAEVRAEMARLGTELIERAGAAE